jgi:hypothetical protein
MVIFGRAFECKVLAYLAYGHLAYFTDIWYMHITNIWYISWSIGTIYICIYSRFVMLYKEKLGNPDALGLLVS